MPQPGRVIISEAELKGRIVELGTDLARDFAHERPILVGVLQGAFLFMADLIRATSTRRRSILSTRTQTRRLRGWRASSVRLR